MQFLLINCHLFSDVWDSQQKFTYQLRSRIQVNKSTMFNLRILKLFSRAKSYKRKHQQLQTIDPVFYNPYGIDLDNFNFMDDISNINVQVDEDGEKWKTQMKQYYEDNQQISLFKLREKQENFISKIDLIEDIQRKLPLFFDLKMSFFIKFRKWEELLVDCDNKIKLIKDPDNAYEGEQQYLKVYNQQCLGYIMSDHDRLERFLQIKKIKVTQKVRKTKTEQNKDKDIGLFLYTSTSQRIEFIQKGEESFDLYFDTVSLQAIGLLVLGKKQNAFHILSKLTGNNLTPFMREETIIMMVTALSYQKESKQSLNSHYISKLSTASVVSQIDATLMSSKSLSALQSQVILNKISKEVNKKAIEELTNIQLLKYGRILCLLAQNYYLEGKKQDSSRLLMLLEKLSDVKSIRMMVTFIKMGISFDNGNLQEVLAYFQQYKKTELNEEKSKASKSFYDLSSINNDLLRVNIYKLMVNIYKKLNMNDKEQELKNEADAMETTLLTYTLKEPQFTEEEEQSNSNWRFHTEVRIPYYYFNLKIEKYFQPNWIEYYSIA